MLLAVGVGSKDPQSLSQVRGAAVGRREHAPFRIEPEVGQRPENSVEPSNKEPWDVLHEDEARSHFANDTKHLEPEAAAGAVESGALPGDGDVLAWKPTGDDVDTSTPGGPVEGSDVVMDWELRQAAVGLPRLQDAAAVGVNLDGADAPVPEQEAAEDPAADTSEEMQLAQGHDRTAPMRLSHARSAASTSGSR